MNLLFFHDQNRINKTENMQRTTCLCGLTNLFYILVLIINNLTLITQK
jgi:hypothetical protein